MKTYSTDSTQKNRFNLVPAFLFFLAVRASFKYDFNFVILAALFFVASTASNFAHAQSILASIVGGTCVTQSEVDRARALFEQAKQGVAQMSKENYAMKVAGESVVQIKALVPAGVDANGKVTYEAERCTGAVSSCDVIHLAAHCLIDSYSANDVFFNRSFDIHADADAGRLSQKRAKKIWINPKYLELANRIKAENRKATVDERIELKEYDTALILGESSDLSGTIPMPILSAAGSEKVLSSKTINILQFGAGESRYGDYSSVGKLKFASAEPFQGNPQFVKTGVNFSSSPLFEVEGVNGSMSNGDSGGPSIILQKNGNAYIHRQVGITVTKISDGTESGVGGRSKVLVFTQTVRAQLAEGYRSIGSQCPQQNPFE